MAPFRCTVLAASEDAEAIAAARAALPCATSYLAHSEGMFAGMLDAGAQLFPGLQWILVSDAGDPVALLPLMRVTEHSGPFSIRALYSPSRFDVLYLDAQIRDEADMPGVLDAVFRAPVMDGHRCDVLRLRDLRSGSPWWAGLTRAGVAPSRADGGASFLCTSPDAAEMRQLSGRNLRSQIKRAERRLGEHGQIAFRVTSAQDRDALQGFLDLEHAGYKRQLNSLLQEDADRLVLSRALETSSGRSRGVVAELLVGSERAASQICLQVDDRVFVLKVAFNEALRDASPGVLLMARFLAHCQAEPTVSHVDFCVRQTWHERWHPQVDDARSYTVPNGLTLGGMALRVKRRLT